MSDDINNIVIDVENNNIVIDIENGIPFMCQRPLNCPKIVIRVYDTDNEVIKNSWVGKRGEIRYDDKGKQYLEVTWG